MPEVTTRMTAERKHLYVTKRGLRERGWTRVSIDRFLDEPDETSINMRHKCGPPVCWYLLTRVEKIEKSSAFRRWKESSQERSVRAKDVAERQSARLKDEVEAWEPHVPLHSLDAIREAAIASYNDWVRETDRDRAHDDSSPDFLERIMVNYIRHELVNYDALLVHVAGRIGAEDARELVRMQVYSAIADTYPDLKGECHRQENRRLSGEWRAR